MGFLRQMVVFWTKRFTTFGQFHGHFLLLFPADKKIQFNTKEEYIACTKKVAPSCVKSTGRQGTFQEGNIPYEVTLEMNNCYIDGRHCEFS